MRYRGAVTPEPLCLRCALCCDGTLFSHVRLHAHEVPPLVEAGVRPRQRPDGEAWLVHRCQALDGHACTSYAVRPTACRRFLCLLATAFQDGEVSLADAVETIARARAQVATGGRDGADPFLRRHFLGAR